MTRRSALLLALGDIGALGAFGAVGLISHEKSLDVEPVLRSIVPFAGAWLLIAPFFGAHSEKAIAGQGWGPDPRGLVRVALLWMPIGIIALVARALVFDRELFNAFFVIALVGHGLFLVGWRWAYAWWVAQAVTRRPV